MDSKNLPIKIQKRLWLTLCLVFIVSFLMAGLFLFKYVKTFYFSGERGDFSFNLSKEAKNESQCLPVEEGGDCLRRAIDGVYVKPGQENIFPIAVIIENNIDARPPSALSLANLVYEAEAEAGITRFLAVYAAEQDMEEIGPVRSARPYLVDWAREFSALFVHCGGSPEALAKIAKSDILDFNEFYNGQYFWRDENKSSPHNIYTSSDSLNSYLVQRDLAEGKFLSWKFKEDLAEEFRPANQEIVIGYKKPDFLVKWKYDREKNDYIRYLADEVHNDKDGSEIRAKNIVIEYADAEVIDEELRLKMNNLGSGKAVVCFDGQCEEGSWNKPISSSRSRFYNNNGEEFEFNAGATWIEVARPEQEISY